MTLSVNGVTIDPEALAREAALHAGARDAEAAARRSLATRELLLQRAGELGLLECGAPRTQVIFADRAQEDAVIAAVLDAEVRTPEPDDEACRRYYDAHPERFRAGALVEVRHILFAATPKTPIPALRARAADVLARARAEPARFAELAREWSNCPSRQQGGNLGQFGRGEMVPEFDDFVFRTDALGVLPELATSRFGFHVVDVVRRIAGHRLPFDLVRERIAAFLAVRVEAEALRQYVAVLAGRARVEGADLDAASTPLVQ
jgi:peptidyl-prolyl cis-trans isomerase C